MNERKFSQQFFQQKTDVEQIDNKLVSEAKLDEVQTEEISITDIVSYGIPTSLVLISVVVFLKLLKTGRQGIEKIAAPMKHFSQVPCRKCRFFSSNPYLKCAIHPSTVLTAQARDCSDYWALDGKFPH
ncbi:MAG: hypothetical protein MUD14_17105 [Hydrococcus sp. Prado102]|nr:hypothetical protein [Hydrococcus sp. Prado102]